MPRTTAAAAGRVNWPTPMDAWIPPHDRSSPGSAPGNRAGQSRSEASGPQRGDQLRGPSIEGYALLEEVHRGGQGVVYRAQQLGTKREVALKVLLEGPFASETSRRRFEREIELAANLRHPSIVTILDSGLSLGRYYFAMEFIRGERLDKYLARRRPPLPEVIALLQRICEAVNYAHQRGVIHRDLKPPNILVDEDGAPHILDFGLAKHMPSAEESTVQMLSTSGQILGTVAYMSPEQTTGVQDVDVRSDVYSLGVIFYELLVGRPPYAVTGPLGEVLTRIARDDAANPLSIARTSGSFFSIDDEIATILLKALEKEPARRYQTAGELARDLGRWVRCEPIEAKRASGLYMLRKTLRRYRLQAAMAGAVLLMLIGFMITFAVLFAEQRRATRNAADKAAEARAAVREREVALNDSVEAQRRLRGALIRQHIERGNLALERQELIEARESYWTALNLASEPAALWALRRYYLQSPNIAMSLVATPDDELVRLAPRGALAASADGDGALLVEHMRTGAVQQWVQGLPNMAHLDLRDDGTLAAAGPDWALLWPPEQVRPSVVVWLPNSLPSATTRLVIRGVYAVGPNRLILIGERQVVQFAGATGQVIGHVFLQGRLAGPTDYSPRLQQIALATSAGVELVSVAPDRLAGQIVWPAGRAPRGVRFVDGRRLAIMTTTADDAGRDILVATPAELARNEWRKLAAVPGAWDYFDVQDGSTQLAVATRDGEIRTVGGADGAHWAARGTEVRALFGSDARHGLLTLHEQKTVTEWMPLRDVEQRRQIMPSVPRVWATAASGAAAVLSYADGRVVLYQPRANPQPRTLLRPRLFGGGSAPAVAIDRAGNRVVIIDGRTVRYVDVSAGTTERRSWPARQFALTDQIALSPDGELLAVLAETLAGDRQTIEFFRWPTPADARGAPPASLALVGAEVRELAFVPPGRTLLLGRSDGRVTRVALDVDSPPAAATTDPWLRVEAAITHFAVAPAGEHLAVAGADDRVRMVSLVDARIHHNLRLSAPIAALMFNPRNNLLLVRQTTGATSLFDPDSGDTVTRWQLPADSAPPMACWIGTADALLLSYAGGVHEHRYQQADRLIEDNRPFAWQRDVERALAEGDFETAWNEAVSLARLAPERGHSMLIRVVEATLRRPQEWMSSERLAQVERVASPQALRRLGNAAYAGERFTLAREWLRNAAAQSDGELDTQSAWRLAQCDYLAGAYTAAAAALADVQERRTLSPTQRPLVMLQRVAALVFAGRADEAEQVALRIGDIIDQRPIQAAAGDTRQQELVALTAARALARFVAGLDTEGLLTAGWETLLTTFVRDALRYRDDLHFFRGELARAAADDVAAARHYQRCIDVARDAWPANWSRFRLAQLASSPIRPQQGTAP